MAKILIVEDDQTLNDGLNYALTKVGHSVISNYGHEKMNTAHIDLVLMDINLPQMNGFERAKLIDKPLIFLTANALEADMLKGFSLGCEDYITKPFSTSVLLEKIKVVLRRYESQDIYCYKELSYDKSKKELIIEDIRIDLTKKEYELLEYFIINKNQVITKQQLLNAIWDSNGDFVNEGTLNVTINRIRKKIDPGAKWIQTVFGIGYKWSENHESI